MLERIFRNQFWLVPFTMVVCGCYLAAQIVCNIALLFLPEPPPIIQLKMARAASTDSLQKDARYAVLNHTNLFDPDQKPITPKAKPAPRKPKKREKPKSTKYCDPSAHYKKSQLPIALKGVVLASDPRFNLALIQDMKRRKVFALRVGDTFYGIRLCAISGILREYEETVTDRQGKETKVKKKKLVRIAKIDRGQGQYERLELGAKAGRGRGRYARKSYFKTYRKLRNTKLDLSKIKSTGKGQYSINRDFLDNLTQRLDIVASQAAIVPYFEKGRSVGFRVYHIRRNSVYQKLGIKNNDVIKRINGYDMSTPQKALEAYSNLMSAKNLSVEVFRKGKRVSLGYNIKD